MHTGIPHRFSRTTFWFSATRCRRGVAIVYVAMIVAVLVGLTGLAADTSYVFWTGHQLQNAADAAALAGANEVGFSTAQAITNAVNAAAANIAGGATVQLSSSTDVLVGNYNTTSGTFTTNGTPSNAVQVTARRTSSSPAGALNLIFGPIFGVSTSNVSRSATAINTALVHPGLLVLHPTASGALTFDGTKNWQGQCCKLCINSGDIIVNSNSTTAVTWTGTPSVTANNMYLCGNDTGVGSGGICNTGCNVKCNQAVTSDPKSSLAAPSKPSNTCYNTCNGYKTTCQPGYYPNGMGGGNCTCSSGTYYVDGGISLSNGQTFDCSSGCLIYLHSGGISMDSTCHINCAPLSTGTYAGVCVYQDRSNSSSVTFNCLSGDSCSGVLYCPASTVTFNGCPNCSQCQTICQKCSIKQAATPTINYTTNLDTPGHAAFLVK